MCRGLQKGAIRHFLLNLNLRMHILENKVDVICPLTSCCVQELIPRGTARRGVVPSRPQVREAEYK